MAAMVKKGVAEYKLCELFDVTGQPWTLALGKKASQLRGMAVEESAKLEAAKNALQARVVSGGSKSLDDASQKRKAAIMENARAARAANPPMSRRVEVSLPPNATPKEATPEPW
eukprot:4889319-Heterocapsa_arctica.AAC.1